MFSNPGMVTYGVSLQNNGIINIEISTGATRKFSMNRLPVTELFEFGLSVAISFCDRHCSGSDIDMAMLSVPKMRRVRVMERQLDIHGTLTLKKIVAVHGWISFEKVQSVAPLTRLKGGGKINNGKATQLVTNSRPTLPPFSEHSGAHGYILEKNAQNRCELET